jgi:hypothetical protein
MLVEGDYIIVQARNGYKRKFHFGETFLVPANSLSYEITRENVQTNYKFLRAFVKP